MDLVSQIIAYECGELDDAGTLALFSQLIKTGTAWELQGSYQRAASDFINQGIIAPDGTIL